MEINEIIRMVDTEGPSSYQGVPSQTGDVPHLKDLILVYRKDKKGKVNNHRFS